MTYRRKKHTSGQLIYVWHWNPNCRNWPKKKYEETNRKPKLSGNSGIAFCRICDKLSKK